MRCTLLPKELEGSPHDKALKEELAKAEQTVQRRLHTTTDTMSTRATSEEGAYRLAQDNEACTVVPHRVGAEWHAG